MKVGVLAKAGCCARKTARPADKDELWSGDVGISQIHERRAVIERRSFFCANLLKSEHLVRRRATRGPQVFDLFGIFGQKQRISNPCGRKFAQFANAGASQVIPKTPPTPSMAARAPTTVIPLHRGCLCIVAPRDAGALAGALHGSWRCTDTGPERNDTFISRALISQVALFSNRAGAGTLAGELLHLSRRGWSPPLNRSQG